MIISREQPRDSVIQIHVSILPQTLLPSWWPCNIEQSPMCYTVCPCWLFILNAAMCTCKGVILSFFFFTLLKKFTFNESIIALQCCVGFCQTMTWISHQLGSVVTQSYLTLCDPMYRSTLGLRIHHQLPELSQTHLHRVSDAIHPTISSSVVPFSPRPQPFPASGSFQMSQFFLSDYFFAIFSFHIFNN